MLIPSTPREVGERGWDGLDIILVSGDTYIDSPYNGSALIGHWLIANGFRVGMIAQPRTDTGEDILSLGTPELFWSVSAGCVDSMVANYTPTGKFRKDDDFTPGGVNNRRPDRACIAYTNLIKRYAKGKPIVLGGVEASLRRVTHYDCWSDSLRRSILLDSKADIIAYGMAEASNLELACRMRDGRDWKDVRGICYMSSEAPEGYAVLPSHEECLEDRHAFIRMFRQFYRLSDTVGGKGFAQPVGGRFLVQNPPQPLPTPEVLDSYYETGFENRVHPHYAQTGFVKAMDTIRNSVTTHRGCYGECGFCSIALMQGRTVVSRSEDSIVREVEAMASAPGFDGIIRDVGGPTANMYGFECAKKQRTGPCPDKRCMYPKLCPYMPVDHSRLIGLLDSISHVGGVRKVFVASGIRYDLINHDAAHGEEYLRCLVRDGHVSGQMKVAPEHVSGDVLRHMFKPGKDELLRFKGTFDRIVSEEGRKLFLTYYLMAAHPGCTERHMDELLRFCHDELKTIPEQVQIFTPTPSSPSTMTYYTRRDWEDSTDVKAEHSMQMKQRQKDVILGRKNARSAGKEKDGAVRSDRRPADRGRRQASGGSGRRPGR